jgi:hypothetical protein
MLTSNDGTPIPEPESGTPEHSEYIERFIRSLYVPDYPGGPTPMHITDSGQVWFVGTRLSFIREGLGRERISIGFFGPIWRSHDLLVSEWEANGHKGIP